MKKNIAVIGHGALGQALVALLDTHASRLEIFDRDPFKSKTHKQFGAVVAEAQVIFLSVPIVALEPLLIDLPHHCDKKTIIVFLSKGVQVSAGKTSIELARQYIPDNPISILSGPMLSGELSRGMFGAAVVGTARKRIFTTLRKIVTPQLKLFYSRDMQGVALCGILKNIYSIGLGIAHGLNLGENFAGYYVTQALREMELLIEDCGGKRATLYSVAGVGDFIATGTSALSRNYQAGIALAQGKEPSYVSEGMISVQPFAVRLHGTSTEYQILSCLQKIVVEKKDPRQITTI